MRPQTLMRSAFIAVLLGGLFACEPRPPCAEVGPVESDGELDTNVVTLGASVTETTTTLRFAAFDEESFVTFPIVERPVLPQGNVSVATPQAACGEGCAPSLWVVSQDDERFFEVGTFREARGDAANARAETRFRVSEGATCDDGDDSAAPASLGCVTDDGIVALAPGQTERVIIDGRPWRLIAVAAGGRDEVASGPDADGPHLFATGVLYRVAE